MYVKREMSAFVVFRKKISESLDKKEQIIQKKSPKY